MDEKEIISKLQQVTRELLDSTGFVEVINFKLQGKQKSLSDQGYKPDFVLEVRTGKKNNYLLIFEVKSFGQPRYVRMAANLLQSLITEKRKYYGVFGAPFVSEESRQICREEGIGFVDLAGNCLFKFDNVSISMEGKPNPYPARWLLKSIFSTRSTRVLRVLLDDPKREWFVRDLAEAAGISIGLASNVKRRLFEYELIEEIGEGRGRKIRLSDPFNLLNRWASNYSYRRNTLRNFYSVDNVEVIEQGISEFCERNRIQYAFTLTSGASRVAPFLRYKRVFAYMSEPIEPIVQELKLKEVTSGPNVTLLAPYDEGIFYNAQDIRGVKVVSDFQLYLDLQSYKERGEEAAEFLLENRLKKKW